MCGGCDTIKTQDEVCERVKRYAAKGHVVFEGLLCGVILKRYVELSSQLPDPLVWAFMDTPLDLCLQRINARRLDKGVTAPLNVTNSTYKHGETLRIANKALNEAHQTVIYLDHRRAHKQIFELLTKGTLDGRPLQAGYRFDEGRAIAMGLSAKVPENGKGGHKSDLLVEPATR